MPSPLTRPRVLVVDDDRLVLQATIRALRRLGADVVPALGGRAALDTLEAMDPSPDLIITDVEMPGLGGEELLRCIRADETFGSLPVVAISGSATDQPFDLHVPKPFRSEDLLAALSLAGRSEDVPDRTGAVAGLLSAVDERPGPARSLCAGAAAALIRAVVEEARSGA
jgi:CheY-like chemotaxis protein